MGLEKQPTRSHTFFGRRGSHERFIPPKRGSSIGTLHWLENIFIATCIIRIRNKSICGLNCMVTSSNFSTAGETWKRVSWVHAPLMKMRFYLHVCPLVCVCGILCCSQCADARVEQLFSSDTLACCRWWRYFQLWNISSGLSDQSRHLRRRWWWRRSERRLRSWWAPQKVDGNRLW